MDYHIEVMHYIVENGPLPSTRLAEHFQWSNRIKQNWVIALRTWGWIVPRGYIEATEEGREEVHNATS